MGGREGGRKEAGVFRVSQRRQLAEMGGGGTSYEFLGESQELEKQQRCMLWTLLS